jgi:hypothetical protein
MLKRFLFLCLGLWLIAASGLSEHAGPCTLRAEAVEEIAAPTDVHAHCDMIAPATDEQAPAKPDLQDTGTNCCCPAVLAAVAAPAAPGAEPPVFALLAAYPADVHALSRSLIPEPPPPKA